MESSDPRIYLGHDNGQPFRVRNGVPEPPMINGVVRLDDRFAALFTTEGRWETVQGGALGKVNDVSGDESIFVGMSFSDDHERAAIWTAEEEFLIPELETVIPQNVRSGRSEALAISADGTTVVGYEIVRYQGDDYTIAWIWTQARGILPVLTLLEDLDIEFDPRWAFEAATAVSDDGTRIVGQGFIGGEEADEIWLLTLKQQKLVVNDDRDLRDANPDDGIIDVDLEQDGEQITLRAAIEFANERPGKDRIEFDIPGDGVPTIQVGLPPEGTEFMSTGTDGDLFPHIYEYVFDDPQGGEIIPKRWEILSLLKTTEAIEIDGTTQPGGWVELSGDDLRNSYIDYSFDIDSEDHRAVNGLEIAGGNSEVRGLVMNRFPGVALILTKGGGNRIAGNRLGTDSTGMVALGNGGQLVVPRDPVTYRTKIRPDKNRSSDFYAHGLLVNSPQNLIGGHTAADRNVIAGFGAFYETYNYAYAIPRTVYIDGAQDARQMSSDLVIAGSNATRNTVVGNYIGMNAMGQPLDEQTGDAPSTLGGPDRPDMRSGILVKNRASGTLIGDGTPGGRNTLATVELEVCINTRLAGHDLGIPRETLSSSSLGDLSNVGRVLIFHSTGTVVENNIISSDVIMLGGSDITLRNNTIERLESIFIADTDDVSILGNKLGFGRSGLPTSKIPFVDGLMRSAIKYNSVRGLTIGGPNPGEGNTIVMCPDPYERNPTVGGDHVRERWLEADQVVFTDFKPVVFVGNDLVPHPSPSSPEKYNITDVNTDGVDSIDFGDLDGKQNYPNVTSAMVVGSNWRMQGNLNSDFGGGDYFLDFYLVERPLNSGHGGESMTYLGRGTVTTGLEGYGQFDISFPDGDQATILTQQISATATLVDGEFTSEFSKNSRFDGTQALDSDGVSDEHEQLFADRNGDGADDSQQSHVASLAAPNGQPTTVAVAGTPQNGANPTLEKVLIESQPTIGAPTGYSYSNGIITFEVAGLPNGASAAIRLLLAEEAAVDSVWILNADGSWTDTQSATVTINEVLLTLTDGGEGDRDGLANGRIVVAIGAATTPPPIPPMNFQVTHTPSAIELTWPLAYPDAEIEFSADLSSNSWEPIDLIPTLDSDRLSISLPYPPVEFFDSGFFRLRYDQSFGSVPAN